MRLMASLLLVAACGSSSPKVETMRTGGMFPARASDCPLELHNGNLDGQMVMAYDIVGFINVTNADDGEPPNSPRILALLKPQACALGGEIVNVGLSANVTYPGSFRGDDSTHMYMVLRKKSANGSSVQKF